MIAKICLQYYVLAEVKALNDVAIDVLKSASLVVFVVATTGQGDDPENMRLFFRTLWALRNERKLLSNLSYAVIGLGDSSYMKFNFSAKRLNKLLQLLGGTPLYDIALADDQHELGPDYVIENWLKAFKQFLKLKLPVGIEPIKTPILLDPKYLVKYDNHVFSSLKVNHNFVSASISLNERKTSPEHFQDVRLIEFDISDRNFIFSSGDVVQVQPQNREENVTEFLSVLGLEENCDFSLETNNCDFSVPPAHILPQPCTVRQCVKSYFDIMSVPTRSFFELLSFFTSDDLEKEKFIELSSPEGQEEYYNYCTRPKRSILEVLADFPHTNKRIPFEYLFDLIPAIKPRDYSIASSMVAYPGKLQILVAVVNYKTVLKRPRLGLCTNWLKELSVGSNVWISHKKGTLTFPSDCSKPVIMIGPGTGCAPFRAYIQERPDKSNIFMVFGCRNKEKDYFFGNEWENYVDLNLLVAFSRDQDHKVYVQNVMRDNYEMLWKEIKNGALIYYAGNAKRTPIDVYEALEYICQKGGQLSDEQLKVYMKKSFDLRYQTESWA